MATLPTVSIDEASPAGSDALNLGDNKIREFKTQNRELMEVDHVYPSAGQSATGGYHKAVHLTAAADIGTGAAGLPIIGAQTVAAKGELVYTDVDNNDVQITSVGKIYLDAARISNNTNIKARNAAGSLDINLIKANASDVVEVPDGTTLATSAAPTADAQIANKKYVDDLRFPQNMQVFTSSGTWTKPAGVSRVFVRVIGNGGTGAGSADSKGYGGGGGGGYSEGIIAVTANVTVTIGAISSFAGTTTIQATAASNGSGQRGGAGGVGSGGTVNLTGGTGGGTTDGVNALGGMGGGTPLGWGGMGGTMTGGSGSAPTAGTGYGGGGGGATNVQSGAAGAGGAIIVYY